MIIPQTSSGQLLLQLSAVNFFPFDDNLPVKGTFLRFSTHLSLSKSWCGATYYVGVPLDETHLDAVRGLI